MKETWPPICDVCGKFMSYKDMEQAIKWTPYGGPLDTDPPDDEWAHQNCWLKAEPSYHALVERISWIKPHAA